MIPFLWQMWSAQEGPYFCISTKKISNGSWKDHFIQTRKELRELLREYKDTHYNLYFCPVGFRKPHRQLQYVTSSVWLWADLDEADPHNMTPRPSVAWASSPNRYAALWRIKRALKGDVLGEVNRRMTYHVGADKAGWDLTQVLRIPGTLNHKYEGAPRGTLLWQSEEIVEPPEDAVGVFEKWKPKLPFWIKQLMTAKEAPVGKRSEVIWKLNNGLAKVGVPPEDVVAMLKASVWNKFKGRRDEDKQLRREVEKVTVENGGAELAGKDREKPVLLRMSDVTREDISWVWHPYFAREGLTLLEGDPGLGKSYFCQKVCMSIVDGLKMPTGERLKKGKVLYFSTEDHPGTVFKGRLDDNRCMNQENFYVYPRVLTLDEEGFDTVEQMARDVKPEMIVFDPVTLYIGAIDMHKANETVQMLERFDRLGKVNRCAVVAIRHLTKGGRDKALYRGQGSIAFAGTAREVLTVGVDPEDDEQRVVAVTKLNLARKPQALTYCIESIKGGQDRSRLVWGDMSDLTSEEILGAPEGNGGDGDRAEDYLKKELADGPKEATSLIAQAEAKGISERTLNRAKSRLDIVSSKPGSKWFWSLPRKAATKKRD